MQSLQLPVLETPLASFKQHRLNSDPSRFALSLSLSLAHKSSGPWAASYPSPPMSGSPTPEQRHEILGTTRHPLASQSPTSPSAAAPLAALPTGIRPDAEQRREEIGREREAERTTTTREPFNTEYALSRPPSTGLISAGIAATATRPTPPRDAPSPATASTSPKSGRRSKAHVASACVNCKRKHLRCDNARPCQRCIQSDKEDSCKDVEHKKRGRPPLKPEETHTGRPYEATFAQVEMPRPAASWTAHRRPSSSRQIRPMPDLRPAIVSEGDRPRPLYRRPGPIVPPQMHPSSWTGMVPSPTYMGSQMSPSAYSNRPFSSGSSQRTTGSQPPSPYHTSQGAHSPLSIPRSAPTYQSYVSHVPPPSMISPSPLQQSFPAPFTPLVHQYAWQSEQPHVSEPPAVPRSLYRDDRPVFHLPPIRHLSGEAPPRPAEGYFRSIASEIEPRNPAASSAEESHRARISQFPPITRQPSPGQRSYQASEPASLSRPVSNPRLPAATTPSQTSPSESRPPQLPPLTSLAVTRPAEQSESRDEPPPKRLKMTLGDMVNK